MPRDKEFLRLQSEWYARLAKDGFVDIEKTCGANEELKQFSQNAYRQSPEIIRETKRDYYLILGQKIEGQRFNVDFLVMTMHAKGMKIAEICRELEKISQWRHRQTVRFIIRKWEDKWGIRNWEKEQMRSAKVPTK